MWRLLSEGARVRASRRSWSALWRFARRPDVTAKCPKACLFPPLQEGCSIWVQEVCAHSCFPAADGRSCPGIVCSRFRSTRGRRTQERPHSRRRQSRRTFLASNFRTLRHRVILGRPRWPHHMILGRPRWPHYKVSVSSESFFCCSTCRCDWPRWGADGTSPCAIAMAILVRSHVAVLHCLLFWFFRGACAQEYVGSSISIFACYSPETIGQLPVILERTFQLLFWRWFAHKVAHGRACSHCCLFLRSLRNDTPRRVGIQDLFL